MGEQCHKYCGRHNGSRFFYYCVNSSDFQAAAHKPLEGVFSMMQPGIVARLVWNPLTLSADTLAP